MKDERKQEKEWNGINTDFNLTASQKLDRLCVQYLLVIKRTPNSGKNMFQPNLTRLRETQPFFF